MLRTVRIVKNRQNRRYRPVLRRPEEARNLKVIKLVFEAESDGIAGIDQQ